MGTLKDLTGQRFGRLTVLKQDKPHYTSGGTRKVMWICKCDCGEVISVTSGGLLRGHTKSCGCLRREIEKNNYADLTGKRFGRLTVLERNGSTKEKKAVWKCQCDCGNITFVTSGDLKSGNTKSCGCYNIEKSIKNATTHGGKGTRLYSIWAGIKSRCLNLNDTSYSHYGGRGITVCDEWKNNFESFRDWAITNGYSDELSIDRINANGNYEPSNCRWANTETQMNNMTSNVNITYNGETHTSTEWSRITGIPYKTILNRLRSGRSLDEVFSKEKLNRRS